MLIRSFEIDGGRARIELGVGGGITADSVPIREWYECLHKAAPLVARRRAPSSTPMLADEPGPPAAELLAAGVFESVLVERGLIVRLAGHLARLDRSCRELYGAGLPADLRRPAAAACGAISMRRSGSHCASRCGPGTAAWRSRVAVSAAGSAAGGQHLAARRPAGSVLAAQVAGPGRVDCGRGGGRRAPCPTSRVDGAVTETSRGNLFWRDADGVWCTPPLDEQVLPGVTRREVVDLLGHRTVPRCGSARDRWPTCTARPGCSGPAA